MRLLSFFVVFFIVSCISLGEDWLSIPSSEFRGLVKKDIQFCVIPKVYRERYVRILESKEIVSLSFLKANELCGDQLSIDEEATKLKPFLSRALFVNEYTGSYRVTASENEMWVAHNSLSHKNSKLSKSALVVFLNDRPEKIYVTANSDK